MQEKEENNTKTIGRLSEYITESGSTFNKLAIELGLSNSYFSKMVKSNGSIGSDIIEKILRNHPDINGDWLLTGRGSMLQSDSPVSTPTSSSDDSIIYKMYQEKDAEVGRLREEIGALKNEIRRYKEENEVREKFVSDVSSESESTKGSGVKSRKAARSGGLGVKNKLV